MLQTRSAPPPPPPDQRIYTQRSPVLRTLALLTLGLAVAAFPVQAQTTVSDVCARTAAVRNAIVNAVEGIDSCSGVTEVHLAGVTSLDLAEQTTGTLKADDFSGLTALEMLNLADNSLATLPAGIFGGLAALRDLRLQGNRLRTLPAGVFSGLAALKFLDLGSNGLTTLPEGVFSGLPALQNLRLQGNSLAELPEGIFSGLGTLTSLNLPSNSLTELPEGIFSGLAVLQFLDLTDNGLTSLPEGIFSGLAALQFLILGDNRLAPLSEDLFSGLTSLTNLSLQDNGLTTLPENLFSGLTALMTLSLYDNSLTVLPEGIFSGLRALRNLRLWNNDLTALHAGAFTGLTALWFLYLQDNDLRTLPAGVFSDLSPLRTLDLSGNPGSGAFLPIADAGANQAVEAGRVFPLSATASDTGPWGDNVAYSWVQTDNSGVMAELTGAGTATPSLVVPRGTTELEFELRITGRGGEQYSSTDSVVVAGVVPTSVAVSSGPIQGDTYRLGEVIELVLTFDRAVTVDTAGGRPSIELDVGGVRQRAQYVRGDGSWQLVFAYTVQSTDSDGDGIRICGAGGQIPDCTGAISPNGGALEYRPGLGALLRHPSQSDQEGHRVDGSLTGLSGGICSRTRAVRDALVRRLGAADCSEVTVAQLEGLTGALFLGNNNIVTLKPGDFADLIALEFLHLDNNRLRTLPGGIFSGLGALQDLRLWGNGLRALPADAFSGLTALQALNLQHNRLSILPANLFSGLTALERLYLDNNRLTELPVSLSSLRALQDLRVGDNGLTALSANAFFGLTALETLQLNGNDLTGLPGNLFSGLTLLTNLALQDNGLTTLPENLFSGLTALTTLQLNGNDLTGLPGNLFSGLTLLTTLSLQENSLTTLPENLFSGLTALTRLGLDDNSLAMLPEGIFSGLRALKNLSLWNNDLTALLADAFTGLTALEFLYLQDNDLMTLPAGVFSDLRSLRTLDLSGNPGSGAFMPVADAGANQAVDAGRVFPLSALASDTGPWGDNVAYSWVQTDNSGVMAELTGAGTATPSLVVPMGATELEFGLRITGRGGEQYFSTARVAVVGVVPTSVVVSSGPIQGDTYRPGEVIELALTFDRVVMVDTTGGRPSIELDVGGVRRRAQYVRGSGSWQLVFAYSVQPADFDVDGIRICGAGQLTGCTGAISPNGGALEYRSGLGALLRHPSQPDQGNHKVDGSLTGLSGGVCSRTKAVRDALVRQLGVPDCSEVTTSQLRGLTGVLSLQSSDIVTLKPGDFADLIALQQLELQDNKLVALPVGVLSGLAVLQVLDLGSNGLTTLPVGVFSGLAALQDLRLQGNSLAELPEGIFSGLTALTTLGLYDNSLTELPEGIFSGLTALEFLYLQDNDLRTLPAGVFSDLSSLRTLDLSGNPGSGAFLPVADAGANQAVEAGRVSPLSAMASDTGPWGDNVAYSWVQTDNSGVMAELTRAGTATPSLVVPRGTTELEFELRITGRGGEQYFSTDSVVVVGVATTSVAVISDPLQARLYLSGEVIELVLTFDRAVTVDTSGGRPSIELDIGGVRRRAQYVRGSGSWQLVFAYSVQPADFDVDGIRICGAGQLTGCTGAISPNGGALEYRPGLGALLRHPSQSNQGNHKVDGSLTGLIGGICGRTKAVRNALVRQLGAPDCFEVTTAQLSGLAGVLSLQSGNIETLRPGDFADLIALQSLRLDNNSLTSLPAGIFSGLRALQDLGLQNNRLTTLPSGGSSPISGLCRF